MPVIQVFGKVKDRQKNTKNGETAHPVSSAWVVTHSHFEEAEYSANNFCFFLTSLSVPLKQNLWGKGLKSYLSLQAWVCVKHTGLEVIACPVYPRTLRKSEWLSTGVGDGAGYCMPADVRDFLVMRMSLDFRLSWRVQSIEAGKQDLVMISTDTKDKRNGVTSLERLKHTMAPSTLLRLLESPYLTLWPSQRPKTDVNNYFA